MKKHFISITGMFMLGILFITCKKETTNAVSSFQQLSAKATTFTSNEKELK